MRPSLSRLWAMRCTAPASPLPDAPPPDPDPVQALLTELAAADALTVHLAGAAWLATWTPRTEGSWNWDRVWDRTGTILEVLGRNDLWRTAFNEAQDLLWATDGISTASGAFVLNPVRDAVRDAVTADVDVYVAHNPVAETLRAKLPVPWRSAAPVRAALAAAGPEHENVAACLIRDGWDQPIELLPTAATVLLS